MDDLTNVQLCHRAPRDACKYVEPSPSAQEIRRLFNQRGNRHHGDDVGKTALFRKFIETRIKPHPHFTRDGLNLTLKLPVSLDEAYSGAQVQVPTPSGTVSLRIPPLSQHGTLLRLKGKGVERSSNAGDMFVQLEVRLPDRADKQVAEALRKAHVGYEKPVRSPITL